jgi:hypothetical protein
MDSRSQQMIGWCYRKEISKMISSLQSKLKLIVLLTIPLNLFLIASVAAEETSEFCIKIEELIKDGYFNFAGIQRKRDIVPNTWKTNYWLDRAQDCIIGKYSSSDKNKYYDCYWVLDSRASAVKAFKDFFDGLSSCSNFLIVANKIERTDNSEIARLQVKRPVSDIMMDLKIDWKYRKDQYRVSFSLEKAD